MPTLDVVKSLNSTLVKSGPLVAVFFGGTGGIAQATLQELVKAEVASGRGLRAYIVGRDSKSGQEIQAKCRESYPKGQFRFVKAEDLSLLRDVDRVCAEITRAEEQEGTSARIDFLLMGQGSSFFVPRTGRLPRRRAHSVLERI
jgi:NAD(P)-dependent dehydrogenase (short-subunit alcohol dehydrogenase family)